MSIKPDTLVEAALTVLATPKPANKVAAANAAHLLLAQNAPIGDVSHAHMLARPGRPAKPDLLPPASVPRRRLGSEAGRIALLHAIAHIEFNAIDLAFDMAARFANEVERLDLDAETFVSDWFGVGADEARHFVMINDRLTELGAAYGDLPAHDGLWEAAEKTADNLAARLVVAPLILEARGLDVTPGMIEKLRAAGDSRSADLLQIIYDEEISHVACGKRWFDLVCSKLGREPAQFFHTNREAYFAGGLKPPFNHEARSKAGLVRSFYEPN